MIKKKILWYGLGLKFIHLMTSATCIFLKFDITVVSLMRLNYYQGSEEKVNGLSLQARQRAPTTLSGRLVRFHYWPRSKEDGQRLLLEGKTEHLGGIRRKVHAG